MRGENVWEIAFQRHDGDKQRGGIIVSRFNDRSIRAYRFEILERQQIIYVVPAPCMDPRDDAVRGFSAVRISGIPVDVSLVGHPQ